MTLDEFREYNRNTQRRRRLKPEIQEKERVYRNTPKGKKDAKERVTKFQTSPESWHKQILIRLKHRAKRRGQEFSITADDLGEVPEFCPILGIPLVRVHDELAIVHGTSPSVDRIDNSKGYIPGNVHIISMRANHMKRDMSFEEIEKLYLYMRGLQT